MTLADVAGARLVFDSYDQTIGSLSGGGSTGGNVELGSGTLTVGDATSTTYAGVISGSGNLIKQGTGSLTLSSSNVYIGATTINAGTLNVNGAIFSASSSVTVNRGGTLGGTGTVNAPVSVASGGAVAPGASTGGLTVNDDVTIAPGGTLMIEIDSAQTPNNDELAVSGVLDITGATLNVQTMGGVSGFYVIATYGTRTGTFASTNVPDAIIDYDYAGGTAIAISFPPAGTVIRIR
jgi:fibronectin-binding autotransporter adhesin